MNETNPASLMNDNTTIVMYFVRVTSAYQISTSFSPCLGCHMCPQAREKLWMALGEAAPVLVPVSHVMMCMNCTSDFSLTLRRHHCNACGKVSHTDLQTLFCLVCEQSLLQFCFYVLDAKLEITTRST